MLPPDSRVVLLDELRPPLGCTLDMAVATTFTLDLAAALIPPLSFAARNLRTDTDRVAALEAVRSCADRVDIFCQAGYMTVPSQASALMEFLAPMIHEVNAPRGFLFHPKAWILRYADSEGSRIYRLLCMSRNLTNDHAWDVSIRLDGVSGTRPHASNAPLAGLLRALPSLTVSGSIPPDRLQRLEVLADEVRRIEWEPPPGVNGISFHVFGVRGVRGPTPDFSGYRRLVVSPFLTDGGLDQVAPAPGETTVVSRVEQLDRLSRETINTIRCYQLSGVAGLQEDAPDEDGPGGPPGVLAGLHAKLYVVERARLAHVFIGSANATDGAFGGNVELLVELVGGASKLGAATLMDGDAPFRSLLEEYEPAGGQVPDPAEEARWRLERVVRALASLAYTADVTLPAGSSGFTLIVRSKEPIPLPPGYTGAVELLRRPGNIRTLASGEPLEATFERVELADVTPFLVFRVTGPAGFEQGTVTMAELLHEPEGRLDEVLAREIDTPEKFFRFLMLLLRLQEGGLMPLPPGKGNGRWSTSGLYSGGMGLFEIVVRGLADRPDAIPDVDRLVKRLEATERGKQTLGDDFLTFWPTVMQAYDAGFGEV